jgi:hypothetical protein
MCVCQILMGFVSISMLYVKELRKTVWNTSKDMLSAERGGYVFSIIGMKTDVWKIRLS